MSRKLALIIGNNDYSNKPLANCVSDATCLANALKRVKNCQVELKTNLKSDDMYECIKAFIGSIKPNDFVIFFFAGHGIQWSDQNFLLPCDDNKITSGDDIKRYATNAQITVNKMAERNSHVVLFLLDCCRSYWMPIKTTNDSTNDQQVGGLNQMKVPRKTLIAYACAAGEVVPDQSEASNNGLFTKCLIKHITTPSEHIETILRKVANDVAIASDYLQIPFRVSCIISEDIYLVGNAEIESEDDSQSTKQSDNDDSNKETKNTSGNESKNEPLPQPTSDDVNPTPEDDDDDFASDNEPVLDAIDEIRRNAELSDNDEDEDYDLFSDVVQNAFAVYKKENSKYWNKHDPQEEMFEQMRECMDYMSGEHIVPNMPNHLVKRSQDSRLNPDAAEFQPSMALPSTYIDKHSCYIESWFTLEVIKDDEDI